MPYFEDFIGPPHTYTVDYDDVDALHAVLNNITSATVSVVLLLVIINIYHVVMLIMPPPCTVRCWRNYVLGLSVHPSVRASVGPSVPPPRKFVNTIFYKPLVGISPNLQFRCKFELIRF